MTSLDRLRQAMNPSEKDRSPVLLSKAIRNSLGKYGLSAAEQLLNGAGDGVEFNPGGTRIESIPNPDTRATFRKDYAAYEQIFADGGIAMPTSEELAAAGVDWVYLAELKERYPNHDLVAPLTMDLGDLANVVVAMTRHKHTSTNPLQRSTSSMCKLDDYGLCVGRGVAYRWSDIMVNATKDWLLDVVTTDADTFWTAYLTSSQNKPDRLNISYTQMKQQNLATTTIPGYMVYQMKRIQQGQPLIDADTWTWALGEFTNSNGVACAPCVRWSPDYNQVSVGWSGVGTSRDSVGVRSPVG